MERQRRTRHDADHCLARPRQSGRSLGTWDDLVAHARDGAPWSFGSSGCWRWSTTGGRCRSARASSGLFWRSWSCTPTRSSPGAAHGGGLAREPSGHGDGDAQHPHFTFVLRLSLGGSAAAHLACCSPGSLGYLLAVDPERVDATRFERLMAEGRAAFVVSRGPGAAASAFVRPSRCGGGGARRLRLRAVRSCGSRSRGAGLRLHWTPRREDRQSFAEGASSRVLAQRQGRPPDSSVYHDEGLP